MKKTYLFQGASAKIPRHPCGLDILCKCNGIHPSILSNNCPLKHASVVMGRRLSYGRSHVKDQFLCAKKKQINKGKKKIGIGVIPQSLLHPITMSQDSV